MAFKQYKISDLIKRLQEQKKKHGDLLIEMSSDEEGNSYSPLGDITDDKTKEDIVLPFSVDKTTLTIWSTDTQEYKMFTLSFDRQFICVVIVSLVIVMSLILILLKKWENKDE